MAPRRAGSVIAPGDRACNERPGAAPANARARHAAGCVRGAASRRDVRDGSEGAADPTRSVERSSGDPRIRADPDKVFILEPPFGSFVDRAIGEMTDRDENSYPMGAVIGSKNQIRRQGEKEGDICASLLKENGLRRKYGSITRTFYQGTMADTKTTGDNCSLTARRSMAT